MSKIKVIQNSSLPQWLENQLMDVYDVYPLWKVEGKSVNAIENPEEYQAVITRSAVGVDNQLVDQLPNLKVISSFGVGYDKIDIPYVKSKNIQVGYTPDVLNDCVADLAWGLLIDVSRQITAADRYVREGLWAQKPYPLTSRVSGKKLGIVGLGRIGQTIAKRAMGFDMEIRYYSRQPVLNSTYQYESSLLELASWCDYLMIAVSGGRQTDSLINAEVLEVLGKNGYLINVSRGSVVDETALLDALINEKIAGAGLDVYSSEPNISSEFINLKNIILSPHMASATHETRRGMSELTLSNLKSFFETGRVIIGCQ